MKTNVVIIVATLLFLSACSNKFSLVKRKYNKGYYVSVNKKATTPHTNERATQRSPETPEKVAVEVVPSQFKTNHTTQSSKPPVNVVSSAKPKPSANSKKNGVEIVAATNNQQVTFETSSDIKPVPAAEKSRAGASDSDVHLVLLVILAILIPPLAVYLKNKTIDMWFWLTLILFLVGYGIVFINGFGGLLALAAIVIALLYVFDVIK